VRVQLKEAITQNNQDYAAGNAPPCTRAVAYFQVHICGRSIGSGFLIHFLGFELRTKLVRPCAHYCTEERPFLIGAAQKSSDSPFNAIESDFLACAFRKLNTTISGESDLFLS